VYLAGIGKALENKLLGTKCREVILLLHVEGAYAEKTLWEI
jgi:hypothetical protein